MLDVTDFHIGKISLTSPIVINVLTRTSLAVETKELLFLWLAHLNNKSNVCKQISFQLSRSCDICCLKLISGLTLICTARRAKGLVKLHKMNCTVVIQQLQVIQSLIGLPEQIAIFSCYRCLVESEPPGIIINYTALRGFRCH